MHLRASFPDNGSGGKVTTRKNCMIWLEMISIRTAGTIETEKVFEICRECFKSVADGQLSRVIVYRSAQYQTDISIHLQWESDPGPGGRSILGGKVRSALIDLGLINHTGWTEQGKFVTGIPSEIPKVNTLGGDLTRSPSS